MKYIIFRRCVIPFWETSHVNFKVQFRVVIEDIVSLIKPLCTTLKVFFLFIYF